MSHKTRDGESETPYPSNGFMHESGVVPVSKAWLLLRRSRPPDPCLHLIFHGLRLR